MVHNCVPAALTQSYKLKLESDTESIKLMQQAKQHVPAVVLHNVVYGALTEIPEHALAYSSSSTAQIRQVAFRISTPCVIGATISASLLSRAKYTLVISF